MSNLPIHTSAIESALMNNDISKLSSDQRVSYYNSVCESVGLNPLTQPLAFITLNGKLTLYAKRDAADQLRKIHRVSISIDSRKTENDLYVVTVTAKDGTGRQDQAMGVIPIKGLAGADLANAMLKCETKAKRRVTLSICGLGVLDETEINDIPKDVKEVASNPHIVNPFKDEPVMEIEAPKVNLGNYEIKVGKKYLGKRLNEIDKIELEGYILYLKGESEKKQKPLTGLWLEAYEKGCAYIQEWLDDQDTIQDTIKDIS